VRPFDAKQQADLARDAANTSDGGTPRATSVATRRSGACSSASRADRRASRCERAASWLMTSDDTRSAASTSRCCDAPGFRLCRGGRKKKLNAAMLATDTTPATAGPCTRAIGTTANR
jgi:hypothetical protein